MMIAGSAIGVGNRRRRPPVSFAPPRPSRLLSSSSPLPLDNAPSTTETNTHKQKNEPLLYIIDNKRRFEVKTRSSKRDARRPPPPLLPPRTHKPRPPRHNATPMSARADSLARLLERGRQQQQRQRGAAVSVLPTSPARFQKSKKKDKKKKSRRRGAHTRQLSRAPLDAKKKIL